VVAAHGRHYRVEFDDGGVLLAYPRGKRAVFACGDRVWIGAAGAIVGALDRRSLLYRSDENRRKLIAANATQLLIVVATQPAFAGELVSRCLVAAEDQRVKALLVLNKADLVECLPEARQRLAPFSAAGYEVLEIAAKFGAAPLASRLAGETTVLVGPSGAGKSTIVNALVRGAEARTREISRALGSGKHTTTFARLYRLDGGGSLIDSPGLQAFGLAHLSAERLEWCFPELRERLSACRFRDCRHDREPGCAVRDAVEAGKISPIRHGHFLDLATEARAIATS
jgi:ribosome biogenesis GTPase